jgi:hypothetical protein
MMMQSSGETRRGNEASCLGSLTSDWKTRAAHTTVIARLDRAIQHAAAYRFKHGRLWNTGSPAFAGDDSLRKWGSAQ